MKRLFIIILIFITSISAFAQKAKVEELGFTWTTVDNLTNDNTHANLPSGEIWGTRHYKLMTDIALTNAIDVQSGAHVYIDLNGNTLSRNSAEKKVSHILKVQKEGNLFIYDSSAEDSEGLEGTGKISGGHGDRGGTLFAYGGVVELHGGTITDSHTYFVSYDSGEHQKTNGCGGAFYIQGGCKFTMYGGRFENCHTQETTKKYGTNIGAGGAVFVDGDNSSVTTFTMEGGEIRNCYAGVGGAVYIHRYDAKSVFNLKGGKIYNCQSLYQTAADEFYGGGAVMIDNNTSTFANRPEFNMSGGTIKNCQSEGHGMAVFSSGNVNISGGNITDCYPYHTEDIYHHDWTDSDAGSWTEDTQYLFKGNTKGIMTMGGGVFLNGANSSMTFTGGAISGCAAGNGGGIAVWNGASLTINGSEAVIDGNHAVYNTESAGMGGGVYVDKSTNFHFYEGVIRNNLALLKGGGIMLNNTSTATINGNCSINDNLACNGGGIAVSSWEDATIEDINALIDKNSAYGYHPILATGKKGLGGGLYIENNTDTQHTVTFSGGRFEENNAELGGGACVDGKIALTLNAEIEDNRAVNGGGIYLVNDAVLNFGTGFIAYNKALKGVNVNTGTTAYHAGVEGNTVYGVGGGVFLDTGTSFKVGDVTKMGLYSNTADFAADDLFANGNSTSVTLPEVDFMDLTDFDIPTKVLYWAEDYVAVESGSDIIGDTEMGQGTNILNDANNESYTTDTKNVMRYRYALLNKKPVFKIRDVDNLVDNVTGKYLCLATGYALYFIKFSVKNLKDGDNVQFSFLYKIDDTYRPYYKVIFTGNGQEYVTREIALPEGYCKIESTYLSMGYDTPKYATYDNTDITSDIMGENGYLIDSRLEGDQKGFYAINRIKGEGDSSEPKPDIREFTFRKTNYMAPPTP